MEQFKDAYEISLWGDVLTYEPIDELTSFEEGIIYYEQYTDSQTGEISYKKTQDESPEDNKTYYLNYYKEEKIGVIGSDSMTAQWRAVEPKLTQNVNGTNTFTFKMFYTYIDTITGERKDNPFQNLLVNERKVKVKWKGKWYDLVIKNCQEDSSGKSVTYTCQDQFINELSKTGFNLEFDNELGNNMGTAPELAETVLEGTDWQVNYGAPIIQEREEPVYAINTTANITNAKKIDGTTITIPSGKIILVFYSVVQNQETYFQFWYNENGYDTGNSSMLVTQGECYSVTAVWVNGSTTIGGVAISNSLSVSPNYRAKRLVRTQETAYCTALNRYVSKYSYNTDDIAYGYQTTVYNDALTVKNLISNGKDFINTVGWFSSSTIPYMIYPPYNIAVDNVINYDGKSHLGLQKNVNTYNSAIVDHLSSFSEGISSGQKYVLRLKARPGTASSPADSYLSEGFNIYIGTFTKNSQTGVYTINTNYLDGDNIRESWDSSTHWITYILTFNKSIARSEIGNNFGLIIKPNSRVGNDYTHAWIQEIEFFEYVENNGSYIAPGEIDTSGVVKTEWRYFDQDYLNVINADDIEYLNYGEEPLSNTYTPFYGSDNSDIEKVRSITGKNSNRFNWLQTIAETFECWVKFTINHQSNGELIYENGSPQKYITFVKDIGEDKGIGFAYGIDLNTISRTINSDQISTKVIVSANSNEFGKDGFCTIARSDENYSKSNFILDFGYYINQGMLNSAQVNLDLYDSTGINGIGYYYNLRMLNTEYDSYNEQYIDIFAQLNRYESQKDITDKQIRSTEEEINSLKQQLVNLITDITSWNEKEIAQRVQGSYANNTEVQQAWTGYVCSKNNLSSYEALSTALETQIQDLKDDIEDIESSREEILDQIAELDKLFNTKYARFIQEGSWISEDYYDDNLYYLDAESVAYTSSRPQIQYNINVLRLSALEEFKNKIFNVGDRCYVQDTEFFGYVTVNGIKTPYKEKVLVSEITSVFDSPEQDTITVQNYKTQFEDLFQRITATTQSLQYSEGSYARAASIVEPTGEINSWTLAKSFEYNEQLAWRATDDSIVINTTGITAVDTTNPRYMVRLSSAGLQISEDHGITWKTGVSGGGISTARLTAGSINVDNIQILSGIYKTFLWNKYGISAYKFNTNNNGNISYVETGNFVRYDQYGIYGVNGINDTEWKPYTDQNSNPLNYIRENAAFGMTWDGFFMRNKAYSYVWLNDIEETYYYKNDNDEYVELESTESFQYGVQYYTQEKDSETGNIIYIEAFILNSNSIYYINEDDNFVQFNNTEEFTQDQIYYEKIYGNGYTEISSDGDIIVFDGTYNRIKIGNLGTAGAPLYGIQIRNGSGNSVMETIDDGSLWLKDRLNIGTNNDNYHIGIGNLGVAEQETLTQVFNANNSFIVYEDGSIFANNGTFMGDITGATGTFSGSITASNGFIGGFAIGENTLISENNSLILQSQNYPETYIRTFDEEKKDGKTYYISQGDDLYIEFTGESFEDGVTYYEKSGQTINANNNFIVYENGTIVAKNGIFSGEINATSGTFAGDISAASGTLGGFKIEQNKLISTNDIEHPSIELNGTEGSIIANNIHLGIGAVIDQYIELGSARIQNPEIEGSNRVFITAGNGALQMKDDGVANFGEITISGPQSVILGDNFAIRPGLSEFNNVNIAGTLKTAVFEVGKVQTIGGMMIFKEGAEIDGQPESDITQDPIRYTFSTKTNINVSEGTILLFSNKNNAKTRIYGIVNSSSIDSNTGIQTIQVTAKSDITSCTNVVQISDYGHYVVTEDTEPQSGKEYYYLQDGAFIQFTDEEFTEGIVYYEWKTEYYNNLLIGTNSSSEQNWELLKQSFTMRKFNGLRDQIEEKDKWDQWGEWSDPLLVLGDLSDMAIIKQKSNISGFGLYGENVYLTGSLTTEVAQNSYAGVNTLSKVTATQFSNDQSHIVFWAGAKENTGEAIQKAPFQVTEQGSIFAKNGKFEGSILTKVSVSASKIYAADLYGWDTNSASEEATAPLTIHAKYENAPGINFVNDSNNPTTTILSINGQGFIKTIQNQTPKNFIDLSNNQIEFNGNIFNTTQGQNTPYLRIIDNKMQAYFDSSLYGGFIFESEQNKITIDQYSIVQTMAGELSFNANTTMISKNMVIGLEEGEQGESHIMEYKRKTNNGLITGYDLYVVQSSTQEEQSEEEEGE